MNHMSWTKTVMCLGIPEKLFRMACLSVTNSRCRLRLEGELSEDFSVNTGVRQRHATSPVLFNIAREEALQRIKGINAGIQIKKTINVLVFQMT